MAVEVVGQAVVSRLSDLCGRCCRAFGRGLLVIFGVLSIFGILFILVRVEINAAECELVFGRKFIEDERSRRYLPKGTCSGYVDQPWIDTLGMELMVAW